MGERHPGPAGQQEPPWAHWAGLLIRKIKEFAARLVRLFDVRARSINGGRPLGGNQQQLILAREPDESPRVLIAHQPTRGLDVGAIEFVWRKILEQKEVPPSS